MNSRTIRNLIAHACRQCNTPELQKGIRFYFSYLSKDTVAYSQYLGRGKGDIVFNLSLWDELSREQKYELVLHETCHIIHDYKYFHHTDTHHGRLWRMLMRCAGVANPLVLY